MSLKSTNKLNANTVELIFNIDKKSFDDAVNSVYKKEAAKITIPGFRKGKAPRAIVEKMYGTGFFYDEAINQIAPYAYGAALDEAGEQPVGQADFEILTIDDNGVDIKAIFPVKPECKIEGYKGIEVERKVLPVTDADVDARIDAARHRNSRTVDVEGRAAADGDIAVIDYEGSVDGVPFEGGKGSDYDLKLGSNTFIPGFEAQIVGHNIGENFDVNVTFPEDYHAEELKGKAAVFAVALKGLKAEELPALDDEFAKDVSEFDTFDEYKADIKKNIENEHKDQADREVSDKIFEALADKLEADIPEAMYANEVEQQINDFEYRLQSSGLKMDMYLKYVGMTVEDLKKQYRPGAEKQVKTRLALETVAKLENIEVSEEDKAAEIKRIAEAYKMEEEQVKANVSDSLIEADLKVSKAADLVKDSAVIKDAE